MSRDFEFEPVDLMGVGSVGEPGRRQFFLRASVAGDTALLACEKFHLQGLVSRVRQQLEAGGLSLSGGQSAPPPASPPAEFSWTIGELGLGYHEAKGLFVIVAREASEDQTNAAVARIWATAEQVSALATQAEAVLAGGRPLCPRCGLPLDPSGHPCPAANGARPVF